MAMEVFGVLELVLPIGEEVPGKPMAQLPPSQFPNWWTDDPLTEFAIGEHFGAQTVSKWRLDYLRDFAEAHESYYCALQCWAMNAQ